MHCLKLFYELAERPDTAELVFLSTHEPCSLCLSAITWCGFDNVYHLFSHEDSRDSFAIPHDLRILAEVFGSTDVALAQRQDRLRETYDELSAQYQAGRDPSRIPLS